MIHVCFGLHDKTGRYSKFTGTAMLSLFDNTTSEVTVHILHDNTLTQDNREKFIYLAGRYGQLVKFYNVEELCADKLAKMIELVPSVKTARVSVGAFYRLLIPQILSEDIDKCVYLDSDMLVNLDIKELWQIELGDKPLAAVREMEANAYNYKTHDAAQKYLLSSGIVEYDEYFNSGLLVMNLLYLRDAEELIMNGVKWRGEHPQCNCFDQDIWNYLFSKNYLRLSAKYDRFIYNERLQGRSQIQKAIYHCTNPTIGLKINDSFNRLWMNYFMKTPFFDEETFGRLYDSFEQIHSELKSSMRNLSAMMSGKTRAFFTAPQNVQATKEIFSVQRGEEIILAENQESLKKLIAIMKKAQGKKLFFIILPAFPFGALIQEGFSFGKDFVNGLEFLSAENGFPLNSYPLIQVM